MENRPTIEEIMDRHSLQDSEIHQDLKGKSLKALQGQIKRNEVWESYSRLSPAVWMRIVHDYCEEYITEKSAKALLEVVQAAITKLKESKQGTLEKQAEAAAQLMRFIQVNTWACIYLSTDVMVLQRNASSNRSGSCRSEVRLAKAAKSALPLDIDFCLWCLTLTTSGMTAMVALAS